MPFSEHIVKSIATGIATNVISIIPGLIFAKGIAFLAKFVPGWGTAAGGIVDATVDFAVLMVMGLIYVKTLTILLVKKKPFTEKNLREAAKEAGSDKALIKETYNEAKKRYKKKKGLKH